MMTIAYIYCVLPMCHILLCAFYMNYLILQPLCEIDNVIPMVQMGKIELSKFLELTNGGF